MPGHHDDPGPAPLLTEPWNLIGGKVILYHQDLVPSFHAEAFGHREETLGGARRKGHLRWVGAQETSPLAAGRFTSVEPGLETDGSVLQGIPLEGLHGLCHRDTQR